MKLLLFDIDGTLLHAHGSGGAALSRALSDLCDRPVTTDGVSFGGRTDPAIVRDILRVNGMDDDEAECLLPEALAAYADVFPDLLAQTVVEVLPGIDALLRSLQDRDDVRMALLTGNLEVTAHHKLRAAGLDGHFPFGAYGSDHHDRNHLPAFARARARRHAGRRFEGREVVVIGDTEHDIACGRSAGALCVAVCTGSRDRDTLRAHAPDVLLDDLRDTDAFVRAVL